MKEKGLVWYHPQYDIIIVSPCMQKWVYWMKRQAFIVIGKL